MVANSFGYFVNCIVGFGYRVLSYQRCSHGGKLFGYLANCIVC